MPLPSYGGVRLAGIFLAAGLLACACGGAGREVIPEPNAPVVEKSGGLLSVPHPLETLALKDLDGIDRSTSTWGGRIVIINVWATWCGPCRRELPYLQGIQARFADRVIVMGLLQDTAPVPFVKEYIKTARVTYPVVPSTFEVESRLPPILMLPMTYVIDGHGRLAATYAGELEQKSFEADLATLLDRASRASVKKP